MYKMQLSDIILLVAIIVAVVIGLMIYFGRKSYAKSLEAQSFINQYKMVTPILVIDKRFEKPSTKNLPKNIYEKLPKAAHIRKMPIVKAKVGPQILTLMCDKNIYDVLPVKKTVKVELAGIYISHIIGMNLEDKKKKTVGQKLSLWLKKNQNNMPK
jgi:hypothetical protein